MFPAPSYDGSGLVNLVAEIEARLTGRAPSPRLSDGLAGAIPEGETYVLVLFDGLGVAQMDHSEGATFRSALAGTLEAPFPTTTSVSLATVSTGLPPSQSGQVAHLHWLPDLQLVVNSLKWLKITGEPVPYDGFGGYAKATQLESPEGAILIESHFVFCEPTGWFNGANLLGSKLPITIQNEVRSFRGRLSSLSE